MNNIIFASVISEIQQSPMFMTVRAVICDTPEANLNGAKVTEKFVDEVVKNEKRYVGLPLYADVKALTNGSYNRLGHLYDSKTGEFHSTQIGSFYRFEKEEFDKGYHLIGYARIPKRNKKLSNAIAELFAQGRLKFSFEVSVGEYDENEDGTITIDASENNYLEGTAIVTYPACQDAVALELVAQQQADDARKGEEEMAKVENKAEVVETEATQSEETVQPELAEEEKVETEEETSEETEENAACKKKEQAEEETAEVYVTETTVEAKEVHAFDTETGKAVHQEIVVKTTSENAVEGTLVEADDGIHVAEEESKEIAETRDDNSGIAIAEGGDAEPESENTTEPETPATQPETPATPEQPTTPATPVTSPSVDPPAEPEETPVTDAVDPNRKTAEQMIAELMETVEELRKEIAEMKEKKVVASQIVTAEINPLMADINAQKKYGLLEKVDRHTNSFSLLEKA